MDALKPHPGKIERFSDKAIRTAMQVTREDLNPCTIKLTISCSPQEVQEGYAKAIKQFSKRIRIPGFRPGHAPRAVVEPMVPPEDLAEAATDNIVRTTLSKAIEQESIRPDSTTRPSVNVLAINKDESKLDYEAKVPLPPKIELGGYKGLSLAKAPVTVSEEEVTQQIEAMRSGKQSRQVVTDRGVQATDIVVVNVRSAGEKGEGTNFMVMAGQSFPALDAAISGLKLEEMKTLELDFPETFHIKQFAGKKETVTISINSISAVQLPELDDAFAKEYNAENVDNLRALVTTALTNAKEDASKEVAFDSLLSELRGKSTVNVSDNMWEALAIRRMTEVAQEQREQGKTLEQYAADNGTTLEELSNNFGELAKQQVERAMVIREVFTKERMQLTTRDLNVELRHMAAEFGSPPEEVLKYLQEQNAMDELQFRSISRKVMDFLIEHATASDAAAAAPAVEAEKPAPKAKKTAAKAESAEGEAAPAPKPKAKKKAE